ncbi:MAG TPA: acyl-CoA dehydrogenase family protein [Trebonia sp.]|jgi:alkylation response protein AidB-like acyl-CoA dehydrogenase|nr:acyl-CoA dehydrogenase family protein [Trebonia sp.]
MSVAPVTARAQALASATQALAAARTYAAPLAAGVIERDRAGSVPWADLAALDASGLLAITVPAAHGGPDMSPVVLAEVIRTIAAVDPAIAQVPQAHFLFVDVLATRVRAAGALLASAAATLEDVGRQPRDAVAAARGSIAVAQAKAFASDTAATVASDIFALTGASAADERYDLSRHWRNARTHASHDPVAWKYHHVGQLPAQRCPASEPRAGLAMVITSGLLRPVQPDAGGHPGTRRVSRSTCWPPRSRSCRPTSPIAGCRPTGTA